MTPSPWLISRRADLTWFFGAVLPALLLLLLFRLAPPLTDARYQVGHPALWLLLLWGVFFDGTHVMGTYARSYLAPPTDSESRRALPPHTSFLIVFLGPALAVLDGLFLPQRPSLLGQAGILFQHFLLAAYLWAYFHLVRQHYGFLVLYQRRLRTPVGSTAQKSTLDAWILWTGCLYPYLRFAISEAGLRSGLPLPLPAALLPTLRVALDASLLLALALLSPPLVRRLRVQRPGPREGFLLLVLVFHGLTFVLLDHLLSITAVLTLFHNLQYHRIVWQYEQGKGRRPLGGIGRYLAAGTLLGLLWYGPRIIGVALVPPSLWRNVLLGLGWGVAFHHYFIDGRIWRVRRTPAVAAALDNGALTSARP